MDFNENKVVESINQVSSVISSTHTLAKQFDKIVSKMNNKTKNKITFYSDPIKSELDTFYENLKTHRSNIDDNVSLINDYNRDISNSKMKQFLSNAKENLKNIFGYSLLGWLPTNHPYIRKYKKYPVDGQKIVKDYVSVLSIEGEFDISSFKHLDISKKVEPSGTIYEVKNTDKVLSQKEKVTLIKNANSALSDYLNQRTGGTTTQTVLESTDNKEKTKADTSPKGKSTASSNQSVTTSPILETVVGAAAIPTVLSTEPAQAITETPVTPIPKTEETPKQEPAKNVEPTKNIEPEQTKSEEKQEEVKEETKKEEKKEETPKKEETLKKEEIPKREGTIKQTTKTENQNNNTTPTNNQSNNENTYVADSYTPDNSSNYGTPAGATTTADPQPSTTSGEGKLHSAIASTEATKNNNTIKIPTVNTETTTSGSSGNSVLPTVAGLSAAGAAGIGTKVYMDHKATSNNDDTIDEELTEGDENQGFKSEEWNGTEEDMRTEYGTDEQNDLTEDDEYSYNTEPLIERYDARSNNAIEEENVDNYILEEEN